MNDGNQVETLLGSGANNDAGRESQEVSTKQIPEKLGQSLRSKASC